MNDVAKSESAPTTQAVPLVAKPQSAILTKLFIALGFITITTIFAGVVSIVALKRFESNFNHLINTDVPTLSDTSQISQLSASVADRGPSLIISPNTWTRLTIVGQVDDDAKWLEEILNRIPQQELPGNRKAELLALKQTLVENYNSLNKLTEDRINYANRLNEIQQQLVQIQKDLVSAQFHSSFATDGLLHTAAFNAWQESIHAIIFKLREGMDAKHPIPLQRLKADVDVSIDNIYAQISKLPATFQREATTRLSRINAIAIGPDGLFNIKMKDLKSTIQVRATLNGARTLAERFVVASELISNDVQSSIRSINQKTSHSMNVTLQAMIGFILISAFIAVLTFLYVSRTVLLRLSNLRISMLAHADGGGQAIDTSGNDEITDMARSLQYMVDTLHSREVGLLEAKEEAESASVAKSRFLAAASHDLRQPLQALNLFVYALDSQEQDPEKREVIELIRNSLDSLKELLNTLLDISKLEAGVVQPLMKDFCANTVIDNIKNEMSVVAWAKDIELRVVKTSASIYSDPFLLGTVVRNLLDNAIKYTDSGKVLIGCRKKGMNLRFEVWDTGPGIQKDQRSLIFQDFYQIDNAARNRTQGLGLGLSIVKRMANLLGCSMGCESVVGKGSMFWVEAPMSCVSDLNEATFLEVRSADRSLGIDHAHVLIFEDDEQVLLGLESVLHGQGHSTVSFKSVDRQKIEQAFAAGQSHPDIVIADYRLEHQITGSEAIAIVRDIVGSDIPAIIITGDTAPERLRDAKKSGFPILHKPVRPESLLALVYQTLSKNHD